MKVTWAQFKNIYDNTIAKFNYFDMGDYYYLQLPELLLITEIAKTTPKSADQTDFEDNYMSLANTKTTHLGEVLQHKIVGDSDDTKIGNVDDRLKVNSVSIFQSNTSRGYSWVFSDVVTVDMGDSIFYLLTTGATDDVFFIPELNSTDQGKLYFYEGPTEDGDTEVTPYNYKRNSTNTTDVDIHEVDTAPTEKGTKLWTLLFGSRSNSKTGSTAGQIREYILKKSTKYLIEIVSDVNDNSINPQFNWYEDEL